MTMQTPRSAVWAAAISGAGAHVRSVEPVEVAWVGATCVEQSGGDRVLLHERSLGGLRLAEERARLHLPQRGRQLSQARADGLAAADEGQCHGPTPEVLDHRARDTAKEVGA